MKDLILKIKQELKTLAIEIREQKDQRGPSNSGFVQGLLSNRRTYRHKHLAYCLLRGRTMEQVERSVREGNEPSEYLINRYLDKWKEAVSEKEAA